MSQPQSTKAVSSDHFYRVLSEPSMFLTDGNPIASLLSGTALPSFSACSAHSQEHNENENSQTNSQPKSFAAATTKTTTNALSVRSPNVAVVAQNKNGNNAETARKQSFNQV